MEGHDRIYPGSFFLGIIVTLFLLVCGAALDEANAQELDTKCVTMELQIANFLVMGGEFKLDPIMFVAPEGSGYELAGHVSYFMVFPDDTAGIAYVNQSTGCINQEAFRSYSKATEWMPILENISKIQKGA